MLIYWSISKSTNFFVYLHASNSGFTMIYQSNAVFAHTIFESCCRKNQGCLSNKSKEAFRDTDVSDRIGISQVVIFFPSGSVPKAFQLTAFCSQILGLGPGKPRLVVVLDAFDA